MSEDSDVREEFKRKFRIEDLIIADFGAWRVSLRPEQLTLGAMVLSLRSGELNLADVTAADGSEMAAAFGWAEGAARGRFGAVRLNVLCLMMQDPIVHFHILPRYDHLVEFAGELWCDSDWPGPPSLRTAQTNEEVLQTIVTELRHAIDV